MNLDPRILTEKTHYSPKGASETYHYFDQIGVSASLEKGAVSIKVYITNVEELLQYEVTNTELIPYITSYFFEGHLPGLERQEGRYKLGTVSGRITRNGDDHGTSHLYLGGQSLSDLKALVEEIEDGQIWPYKVPQKEHASALKLYRKTYGMPAVLASVALLLVWLVLATIKNETYLSHLRNHDMGQVMLVHSLWGMIVALLCGSWFSYLFAKDIRPMLRITLSIVGYIGLLFFIGCFYYLMFTS